MSRLCTQTHSRWVTRSIRGSGKQGAGCGCAYPIFGLGVLPAPGTTLATLPDYALTLYQSSRSVPSGESSQIEPVQLYKLRCNPPCYHHLFLLSPPRLVQHYRLQIVLIMSRLRYLGVLAAAALFESTHAINACPVTDTVFTGAGGIRYRVCPDTDLIGDTTTLTANVASTTACAQLCDQAMNCFRAVYDTQTRDCHIKGAGNIDWQPNARFDVIQAEQVNIARCPYAETAYANGGVSRGAIRHKTRTNSDTEKLQDLQGL